MANQTSGHTKQPERDEYHAALSHTHGSTREPADGTMREESAEAMWLIINNASLITAFFAVLMTASLITAAMGVQLDDGAFEIFEPEHIYTRSRDTRRNKFYQRPNQDPIVSHLFYGLKKENPWNNDGLHPASRDRWEYRGQVYDKKFDLFSQQEAFMTACREYHGSLLKQGIASTTYYQSWDGTITFPKTYYWFVL